ncbi:MAG: type VI secretion system membrane subunit TssM [Burkholderiales bacterium]|nr:type VI secretion system membrane subunit TssM [Burkholderiales bacterium]
MKKLFGLIFNRWTMAALGLTAIALLIWFIGPMIAVAEYRPLEPVLHRQILIGAVVLIYLGKLLWKLFKSKQSNARLMDGLLKQAPAQAAREESAGSHEVATLHQRFEEAVQVLKQAKLGGKKSSFGRLGGLLRRQYLYELPWYVFIGAPGSGKTTALIYSGLQFPLAERFGQKKIQGIGGTRNCDWWFSDEAVLLDTAGRYTTQESDAEVDKTAWTGFLQLLKKHRPRRPINGVLVTVSVADLLQQNASQREAHASALRKRIQELHEQLGIRFPVYALVSKADLLAGFMEFFGEYGKEERAQVWGVSFPLSENKDAPASLGSLRDELSALEQRLNERLIDRLQQERDPQKRALIYTFPQQFAAIREPLADFLDQVFSPSRFEEKPLLRGVYFTSGTQEGSPIDRILAGLGRALRLDRKVLPSNRPTGKSFFLTRLLRDVIFQEAGLAGTNLRWERRRAALQWSALALAGIITATAAAAWWLSYTRNKAYITSVQANVNDISKQVEAVRVTGDADVVKLLPILKSVRDLSDAPHGPDAPWDMGLGLYQGDKLEAASDHAYRRMLNDSFLPRLAARVEQLLRSGGQQNPELLYEALKAYIMLHDVERFDASALKAFITTDWESNLPREVTLEQRAELGSHLNALLDAGAVASPVPADSRLIASVRDSVSRTPIAQRVYNRLKQQNLGADLEDFTIAEAAGPSAPLVFTRASGKPLTEGVPGLFTHDGYYKAFRDESERVAKQLADEESWVLGLPDKDRGRFLDPRAQASLIEQVRRLYLEDYARIWEAFINDIKLVRGGNLQHSIQLARILSAPDSPLPLLLRGIVKEVTLVQVDQADKGLLDKGKDIVAEKRKDLENLFGKKEPARASRGAALGPEAMVDNRFESLRRMVRAAPGQPAPIDATINLLNELYTVLTATELAVKGGNVPPQSDVTTKIKAEAGRMPEPVRSMLSTLSTGGSSQALSATRANISQSLNMSVGDFCNKAISGRYPFNKSSERDVTQDDFARLFAPGGLLDEFFQKNLAQFVDTSTRPWSFRRVGDVSMGGTSNTLLQFQLAQTIRDVFFRGGGKAASMRLEFKPMEMDASITHFVLDIDGQLIKYSHGPQVPTPVQWPGPRGNTQVRLQLSPPSAGGTSGQMTEGPWALFRMFDRAKIDATGQPEKFFITFNVDGRKARFEVVTSSVQNPFRLRELDQFQCPGRL